MAEKTDGEDLMLIFLCLPPDKGCPLCGGYPYVSRKPTIYVINPSSFRISKLISEEQGWVIIGKGRTANLLINSYPDELKVETECRTCGSIYEAILRAIPVQTAQFSCPKCKQAEHLTYRINYIKTTPRFFEFEAVIECKRCNKRKSLRKILRDIFNTIKIEVGAKGITIKNA